MPVIPDTKDWTWVVDRPCDECGFDARDHPKETIGQGIRVDSAAWDRVLRRDDVAVRPNESTWSPLEYACHVRDVYRVFDQRLALMLSEDDPVFANWDQDETAVSDRYDLQDPATVAGELRDAAQQHAHRFDSVTDAQWSRPGTRSNGSRFTVETLGIYGLHDPRHHVWDVTKAG
jgi:DinB superfamily